MKKLVALFLLSALLGGCAIHPRPLTLEEQNAYMARQQCEQEANWQTPEWVGMGNPCWEAYFITCMNSLGVPDSVLYRMWY